MKIYNPNFRWGSVTPLRQTFEYTGLTINAQWYPQYSTDSDFFVSTSLDSLDPFIHQYPLISRFLLVCENESIFSPSQELCAHYGSIISPFRPTHFTGNWIKSHPSIPWFYGIEFSTSSGLLHHPLRSRYELKRLANYPRVEKTKFMSAIVSGKQGLVGHRWRQEVALELKRLLKDDIDIYGFGHNPLPDKRFGLDQYLFTLVIENMQSDSYWTEKLSDAFLARTIPIYIGCKNIGDYFSLSLPNVKFAGNVQDTARAIISFVDRYSLDVSHLDESRNLVLYKYNMMYSVPESIINNREYNIRF